MCLLNLHGRYFLQLLVKGEFCLFFVFFFFFSGLEEKPRGTHKFSFRHRHRSDDLVATWFFLIVGPPAITLDLNLSSDAEARVNQLNSHD